jgi:hypothetical protein
MTLRDVNRSIGIKTCTSVTLSTTNSTWNNLERIRGSAVRIEVVYIHSEPGGFYVPPGSTVKSRPFFNTVYFVFRLIPTMKIDYFPTQH